MRDFVGFRFGNVHSKDLHLVVVSSSDRYEKNLLPNNKDYTIEVPGGDGSYYFGSTFENREFTINVAFDKVDENTWRKMSNLFSTDKLQDLVFDELPYKTYRAKLKTKPEYKMICFTDRDTGQRVYKGEGTLNFICYFPYAYCFNKYIIRAADYYLTEIPEIKNFDSIYDNPYRVKEQKVYNITTKDYYNVKNNMNTPWKGGYPTIEQVRAGELFFDFNGKKEIINVRDYFRNVPEWAESSKLLVTPTLDYDQELIFLPQYSKTENINMDIGFTPNNSIIGSRMLVYNPGDIPIDFEIKSEHVQRAFKMDRGNHFRIRRFNVQRLSIPNAVDWTGLTTLKVEDNKDYKYGNKYFKFCNWVSTANNTDIINIDNLSQDYKIEYVELGDKHPNHVYIAEPIPKEKLSHYIKLFYWQSSKIKDKDGKPMLNFEDGIEIANRYEELYNLCITDEERYELYWNTLKDSILKTYNKNNCFKEEVSSFKIENNRDISINNGELQIKDTDNNGCYLKYIGNDNNEYLVSIDLYNQLIGIRSHPLISNAKNINDVIITSTDKKEKYRLIYNEKNKLQIEKVYDADTIDNFIYNYIHNPPEFLRKNPSLYYGQEEFNISAMPQWYTGDFFDITTENIDNTTLFLDSEKRMLYNIINPEYNLNKPETAKNWYDYKPKKEILNDNIEQGHWFKIPPGWSLIEVIPICDEDNWGGKRWLDARPFDWGYGGQNGIEKNVQKIFDFVYEKALIEFFNETGLKDTDIRIDNPYEKGSFLYEYYKTKENRNEYKLLKLIHSYWKAAKDIGLNINGSIEEWWWYACNYIWRNFPPLYWGYADILNDAKIKYTPLFY